MQIQYIPFVELTPFRNNKQFDENFHVVSFSVVHEVGSLARTLMAFVVSRPYIYS